MTTTADTEKLATVLVNAVADWHGQTRPKAKDVAKARAQGIADGAHALGYGRTPAEVLMVALDWVRANPRPTGGAFPTERKAWEANLVAQFTPILDNLD